ncbi:uncharacterized protein Dana_GF27770 [Drosophila ananassae]|uniref:Uncharacterized protein n=1 Tax=Drosophila ananassae TaxID=7217 RepID=A0A0P8Y271_DROAN|nr:uncharacterized protein Dana_GF27770 [Drosophila ananassae]
MGVGLQRVALPLSITPSRRVNGKCHQDTQRPNKKPHRPLGSPQFMHLSLEPNKQLCKVFIYMYIYLEG